MLDDGDEQWMMREMGKLGELGKPEPKDATDRHHARDARSPGPSSFMPTSFAPTKDSLAELLGRVAAAPSLPLHPHGEEPPLEPGARIADRFTVERLVGVGGMGSVYLTHDDELERLVAVKLVFLREDAREREQALREARAMAKLSHPNVVTVHDVGLVDEQHLFIAMEYVDGGTARTWVEAAPRRFAEILRLYLEAGAGLVAAHAKGMVHRDFKPDNVLVGQNGRARIADFGLARPHTLALGPSSPDPEPDPDPEPEPPTAQRVVANDANDDPHGHSTGAGVTTASVLHHTQTDGDEFTKIAGTLAYMAPEQFAGARLDARADQYAFCASLWEALYGQRPYLGPWFLADEPPRRPKSGSGRGVPRWIEPILRRGLSRDPRDRFADMTSLLDALERPARSRRRWSIAAGVVALSIAAGVSGFTLADARETSMCEVQAARPDELWTPARRARFAEALEAADATYGTATYHALEAQLGTWSQSWSSAYATSCLERASGDADPAGYQARLDCLDEQLRTVSSALEFLEDSRMIDDPNGPDAAGSADLLQNVAPLVRRTESFTYALPQPIECSLPDAIATRTQLQRFDASPEAQAILRDFERVAALDLVGDMKRGLPLGLSLVERTQDPEFSYLHSWALLRLGSLQRETGDFEAARDTLLEAFFAARGVDDDGRTASAAIGLIWTVGMALGDLEGAKLWARHAQAAMVGREADSQRMASLESALGVLDEYLGDYESSLEHHARAVAFSSEYYGAKHPMLAPALSNQGAALDASGRTDEAYAAYEAALEIRQRAFNRPDATAAMLIGNRGLISMQRGDFKAAVADQRQALAIYLTLLPPDSAQLIDNYINLALALYYDGQRELALEKLDHAQRLAVEKLGEGHPDVAYCAIERGHVLLNLGRLDESQRAFERARHITDALEHFYPDEMARLVTGERDLANARKDLEGAKAPDPNEPNQ